MLDESILGNFFEMFDLVLYMFLQVVKVASFCILSRIKRVKVSRINEN